MYKKILAITLAALLFLAGVNPAFAQDGNDNPPDGTIALTIVHTNDTHGQYKNSASTVAVSYTHLDVYKRQAWGLL